MLPRGWQTAAARAWLLSSGDGSRGEARGWRRRARPRERRLVRAERPRRALVPRAGPWRQPAVDGQRRVRGRDVLPPARHVDPGASSRRAELDVSLGDRAGGLPRARGRGDPDRRRCRAAAPAVGFRPLPARERGTRSSGPETRHACCSPSRRASSRRTARGASTAPTSWRAATTPARPRTRRTAPWRTRGSRHRGLPATGMACCRARLAWAARSRSPLRCEPRAGACV